MKNMVCCKVCWTVYVDDKPLSSLSEMARLVLIAKFDPDSIFIEQEICPNCKIFIPDKYWDGILKKI